MSNKPELDTSNQIGAFVHCALCLKQFYETAEGAGQSPAEYARLSVGWTPRGIQVWCERHDVNVLNIDFEGHKHPGLTERKATRKP
jgi:hypothetical protein